MNYRFCFYALVVITGCGTNDDIFSSVSFGEGEGGDPGGVLGSGGGGDDEGGTGTGFGGTSGGMETSVGGTVGSGGDGAGGSQTGDGGTGGSATSTGGTGGIGGGAGGAGGAGCDPITSCLQTQCDVISDNCGGWISCEDNCANYGGTCNTVTNLCQVCSPDPISTTCQGVQCGNVLNNCGDSVNCDGQPDSGCPLYQTCDMNTNTCYGCTAGGTDICGASTPKPYVYSCENYAPPDCDYYNNFDLWCCPYPQ